MYPSHVYTCIYKADCLVICIYVCTCLHGYIYACTYMHIFNGDGFYEHFMILFTIYHLHNMTSECPYNMMRCYFMMLNFKCTVSYFTVLPCMLFLTEMCPMYHYYHVLCQQWRNKDVQSINKVRNCRIRIFLFFPIIEIIYRYIDHTDL